MSGGERDGIQARKKVAVEREGRQVGGDTGHGGKGEE
jgi:hypothetical protein